MKILQYGIILLCIVTLWGCGKGNSGAPAAIDPATKKHVISGWPTPDAITGLPPHATDATGYYAQPDSCKECHGADLSGGISKVSCGKCHNTPFPHGQGFAAFNAANVSPHGTSAKSAVGGLMAGMAYCKKCHGADYNGRSSAVSCIGCHRQTNPSTNAPHAGKWASYLLNARGLNHSSVAESNAPACAQCHANKANLSDAGKARVAGFATPGVGGCFDNSLCHNQAGHTFTWVDHMVPARSNLASCQSCHATPSSGPNPVFNKIPSNDPALTPYGCETCHFNSTTGTRTGLAHPYMWLPGRGSASATASHTNAGNMLVSCGLCHGAILNGAGGVAPSCMSTSINSTACHFTTPVNAGGTVGCKSCHGNPPDSASATAAPNRAYRHTSHFANIASLTCDACHSGYGSGTISHATKVVFSAVTASVAIPSKFNESGATASYSSVTGQCTNVSCHGGKPNLTYGPPLAWLRWKNTAVFDQTNCYNCHLQRVGSDPGLTEAAYRAAVVAGTRPYIGPFSGKPASSGNQNLHFEHFFQVPLGVPGTCLACHKDPGAGHFTNVMSGHRDLPRGFAAGTVGGLTTNISIYDPGTSSCTTASASCHPGTRTWY